MGHISLSGTEMEILQILWKEERGLSGTEIVEKLSGKAWNPNSIYQVLNSMMKKGVLEVTGMVRCGKSYGRLYSPSVTQNTLLIQCAQEVLPEVTHGKRLLGVVAAFAGEEKLDLDSIEELEKLLAQYRKELE